MPITTYEQALAFWFDRVNYEQRGMPADLRELNLDRMSQLLDRLGHPEKELAIVHIAGSKGKGSTSAMLASILQRAGLRTGLFTSPHLCHVEERVQVDGLPISAEDLTVLMGILEPHVLALEAAGTPPTFFEIVTALALLHFARQRVSMTVLEVGLGGRFDATNVCTPRVAIITSISFDHTQQLGTTLAAIAGEKAGIIKPGRPTISGVLAPEARTVIVESARRCGSTVYQLGSDFGYDYTPGRVTAETTSWPLVRKKTRIPHSNLSPATSQEWQSTDYALGLFGEHQAANAAVAVVCIEELRRQGWQIPEEAVQHGLRQVQWPARMEVLQRRPMVILDCAHNVASMQALVDTLDTTFPPGRRGLLLACSRDKDITGIIALLAPHFTHAFLTRYATGTRAAHPDELAALWRRAGGSCDVYPSANTAWQAAQRWANRNDLLCVTGSVFLAGELRPLLQIP